MTPRRQQTADTMDQGIFPRQGKQATTQDRNIKTQYKELLITPPPEKFCNIRLRLIASALNRARRRRNPRLILGRVPSVFSNSPRHHAPHKPGPWAGGGERLKNTVRRRNTPCQQAPKPGPLLCVLPRSPSCRDPNSPTRRRCRHGPGAATPGLTAATLPPTRPLLAAETRLSSSFCHDPN